MGLLQKDVKATYFKGLRSDNSKSGNTEKPHKDAVGAPDTLTLITSDGEIIVFDGMDIPIGEATALASEDALGKIWNRQAEDLAWRDM